MAKAVKKDEQKFELLKVEPKQIAEFETLKSEVLAVVEKHPFIEIKDSKTYKAAKDSRKALRDISLKVEKEDGTVATFMIGLRKKIGTFLVGDKDGIGGINKLSREPFNTQDEEVKRWEKLVQEENEKEQNRLAEERQNKINEINGIVDEIKDKITAMTYDGREAEKVVIERMISERKGTFGIYDVYFDPHLAGFNTSLNEKIETLENANEQAETNRKNGITNHIGEIELAVKNLILGAKFETIDETKSAIDEIMTTQFDFQEFESMFESKSDDLLNLWNTTKKNLEDAKELADLRADKLYNKRSEVLLEIGMELMPNGDFMVNDLTYSKKSIIDDSDEYFDRTVENIERFIAGENAKPNVQLIDDNEQTPTVESIAASYTFEIKGATNFDAKLNDGSVADIKLPEAGKTDFVKLAEEKLAGDPSMGGSAAFHGATEMLEEVKNMEVDMNEDKGKNGIANNVGELIELLFIMDESTPLAKPIDIKVSEGKVYFKAVE